MFFSCHTHIITHTLKKYVKMKNELNLGTSLSTSQLKRFNFYPILFFFFLTLLEKFGKIFLVVKKKCKFIYVLYVSLCL